ncbi:MAG: polysaccharide biosynthesis C-terminal domain-containing protein [Deltaproteobacteria bacterium]|nr:polysaccharide biosynthesis C-terminal domain-containing protein [Deltaproteobacteria bacterium]
MTTASSNRHDVDIARGAGVNVLGIIGKALLPAFYVLVTRLFGPALMGVYYLATQMIEVAITLTVSGFSDGILMFASRYVNDKEKEDRLYRVMANGVVFTLGISALLILFSYVGGPAILLSHYPQPGVLDAVQALAWSLPLIGVPTIVIAATKSLLIMKWDAILLGFLRPALLVVFAFAAWAFDLGLDGLLWGYVASQAVLTIVSLFVFARHFSYARLAAHMIRFRPFGPLAVFALPQNLNMTFNTLIGNLDVMMLGSFGFAPEILGFYGMGSQIVRNVRQVKLAFSGSYAPVIARFHERGDLVGLSESFSTVARWTTTIGLPIALAVGLLREDLLRIFHPSFTMDSTFMLLLLVPPVLSCSFGLAGNIVVMTGHSMWNLFNSVTVAALNLLLLWLLIPPFGIVGAAAASLAASTVITIAQLVEAQALVGARLVWARIHKPFTAALPAVAVGVTWTLTGLDGSLPLRIVGAILGMALFAATLKALGIDPKDRAVLRPWSRSGPEDF